VVVLNFGILGLWIFIIFNLRILIWTELFLYWIISLGVRVLGC
jgi:hypothetical protein